MRYFITLLALCTTAACCADEQKETPTDWNSIVATSKPVPDPQRTWELTLIKVDGEFVDLDEPDWRFHTRNDCMRDAIYRMQQALDNQSVALRTDKGSVATHTQYLGFICEELTEKKTEK